jgi:Ca2+-binding EF-hand superfamily protein
LHRPSAHSILAVELALTTQNATRRRSIMRWVSWLLAVPPAILLALAAAALPAPKKDPAGTALVMGQLRLVFATWDINGDGYLDKQELAKAFRGADAKAYERPKDGSSTSAPDFAKYPDHALLIELDVNGDGRISKDEFEAWARDYAVALKHQEQAQKKIATAEHKLLTLSKNSSKMTPKELATEQKTLENELKKEQEALKKLSKVYDKQFQQAMKQGTKK